MKEEIRTISYRFTTDILKIFNKMYKEDNPEKVFVKIDKFYLNILQVDLILRALGDLGMLYCSTFKISEIKLSQKIGKAKYYWTKRELRILIENETKTKVKVITIIID